MTPCPFCLGSITWSAAYREWHGRCDGCSRYFFARDERCANRDRAVRLVPAGSEWVEMELEGS